MTGNVLLENGVICTQVADGDAEQATGCWFVAVV